MLQCSRFFTGPNTGPVHVNIPVREPSMPDVKMNDLFNRKKKALPDCKMADEAMNPFHGTSLLLIGGTRGEVSGIGRIIDGGYRSGMIQAREHLGKFSQVVVTL